MDYTTDRFAGATGTPSRLGALTQAAVDAVRGESAGHHYAHPSEPEPAAALHRPRPTPTEAHHHKNYHDGVFLVLRRDQKRTREHPQTQRPHIHRGPQAHRHADVGTQTQAHSGRHTAAGTSGHECRETMSEHTSCGGAWNISVCHLVLR